MKKLAIASVAALALTGAASAQFVAQESLTININGEVEEICSLTPLGSGVIDVDFGVLSDTAGQIREDVDFGIVCNSAEGANLEISSLNSGKLLREGTETGDGNEIAYSVNPQPGSDRLATTPGTPPTSLANDKTYLVRPGTALREGRNFGIAVYFDGVKGPDYQGVPTTTVFAGNYSDTITVSLTAN